MKQRDLILFLLGTLFRAADIAGKQAMSSAEAFDLAETHLKKAEERKLDIYEGKE